MSTNPVRTRPLPVVTPRNSKTTTHCKLCYLVTDLWRFFCKKLKNIYSTWIFIHFLKISNVLLFFHEHKNSRFKVFRVLDFFCSLQKTFQTFSSGVVDLHRVPVITQMIFFSDFTKQSMQLTVSIIFESSTFRL